MNYDTLNLLGLQPEDVETVNIVHSEDIVNINVTLKRKVCPCPCCGSIENRIKDYKNKKITHSILNTNKSIINYRRRRYVCNDCGKTFLENNIFSQPSQRISTATIMQVLKDCKRLNYTFSSIAEKNYISVSSIVNIFDQYVDIKPGHFPKVLSIDEFYLGVTWSDKFACIFIDWETSQIIDIYPSRKKYKLYNQMQYINKEEFKNVKYVSIDMNPTYKDFALHHFKNVIVLVDSFHVVKNINEALNKLRIDVMKTKEKTGLEYYLLKHWNFLLLKRKGDIEDNDPKYNKRIGRYINMPSILDLILKIDPILTKAYQWKEDYLDFNQDYSYDTAPKRYDELYNTLVEYNINQFKEVVTLLKNWRKEILNSFTLIDDRRISNGPIESINNRIKILLKTALKYKNFMRLRNRIMYCINKDTLPVLSNVKKSNKLPGRKRGSYIK